MIAHCATHDDGVTFLRAVGRDVHVGRDHADARCVDIESVAVTFVDHFGVARHKLNVSGAAGGGNRSGDAPQRFHRQPLFQNKSCAEE